MLASNFTDIFFWPPVALPRQILPSVRSIKLFGYLPFKLARSLPAALTLMEAGTINVRADIAVARWPKKILFGTCWSVEAYFATALLLAFVSPARFPYLHWLLVCPIKPTVPQCTHSPRCLVPTYPRPAS